jgi:hypothetical protein
MPAVTNKNKHKKGRKRNGLDVRFEFVLIDVPEQAFLPKAATHCQHFCAATSAQRAQFASARTAGRALPNFILAYLAAAAAWDVASVLRVVGQSALA